eukprot:gene464-867_t
MATAISTPSNGEQDESYNSRQPDLVEITFSQEAEFDCNNDDRESQTIPVDDSDIDSESYRAVPVADQDATFWTKLRCYIGPGVLVAVGYMDPGNWSTDIAAGSLYNYKLLAVIFISYLIGLLLQALTVKLGITLGRDLAQACRDSFPPKVTFLLWIIIEAAIAATDLAEVLGSAIALKLLLNIPIVFGVCITVLDVLLLLFLQRGKIQLTEIFIFFLISTIAICFLINLIYSEPDPLSIISGYVPSTSLVTNTDMLYVGLGILGATVMPHNLFLHSSLVLTRASRKDEEGKKEAIKYGIIDSTISLTGAFFVNSAILVLAASTFYKNGYYDVASIEDAYYLLDPVLGKGASILFGIALLASGQSSTFTGTLSGQIVMEGFLSIRLPPYLRRLITRLLAVIPALIVVSIMGEEAVNDLLVLSQVILSITLPFGIFPLVFLTSDKNKMGSQPIFRLVGSSKPRYLYLPFPQIKKEGCLDYDTCEVLSPVQSLA